MKPEIHLHVLASGSKGNAAVVEGPEASILIDCGISRRELMRRAKAAGCDMDRIAGVFLTHEHSDHTAGLTVLCNHFEGPLFATAGTAAARPYLSQLPFTLVEDIDELEVGGLVIRTFPTSHDVADPMGLRIESANDALGFCTDTGFLTSEATEQLRGVRILAIESNHDERMLRTGEYPAFLKARIAGDHGHLSNNQTATALPTLVDDDTETIIAMHLSHENNRPSIAVRTLAASIGAVPTNDVGTEARTPDGHVTIIPASQEMPVSVW